MLKVKGTSKGFFVLAKSKFILSQMYSMYSKKDKFFKGLAGMGWRYRKEKREDRSEVLLAKGAKQKKKKEYS